jgi:hypothetical protein
VLGVGVAAAGVGVELAKLEPVAVDVVLGVAANHIP